MLLHHTQKYVIFVLISATVAYVSHNNEYNDQLKAGFMVSIRNKFNQHRCGGALISIRSVITNADCVFNETWSELLVVVGTNVLNQGIQFLPDVLEDFGKEDDEHQIKRRHIHAFHDINSIENNEIGDEITIPKDENVNGFTEKPKIQQKTLKISPSLIFSIKNIYFHKNYDGKFLNNIAVLELDRRVSLLNGVNVIGIINNHSNIQLGDTFSLYGWDNQLIQQNPAHVISKVSLNFTEPIYCSTTFGLNFKQDSELCLKAINHVPSNGFGGSPVTKNGLLVGIISYGAPKNSTYQLTVAVNLTYYTTFIQQVHDDIESNDGSVLMRFIYLMRSTCQSLIRSFVHMFENI